MALGATAAFAPAATGATFEVTTLGDASPPAPCDATCSLRDAVAAANYAGGADAITFSPSVSGQIVLNAGQILIQEALTIQGPGAANLSISGDANGNDLPDAGDSRIFVAAGANDEPVSISGLTLTEGFAAGGGAIVSDDVALSLEAMRVTDNRSTTAAGGVLGANGPLTITGSTLSSNSAPAAGSEGGAVLFTGDAGADTNADLTIRDSTISGNSAGAEGGGLYFDYGSDSALVERTTFNSNQAGTLGGGIFVGGPDVGQGPVTIQDATVSGNTSGNDGGGIAVYNYGDGEVAIRNSTIASNGATDRGGGIFRSGLEITTPGTDNIVLSSTIVASNTAGTGADLGDGPLATGSFNGGFNLIGDGAGAAIVASPPVSNVDGADPQLASLADNGGSTQTMLPAETSPAIDQGIANGLSVDQRGEPRMIDQPSIDDAGGGDGTDIGAVELGDFELSEAKIKVKKTQKQRGSQIKVKLTAKAAERVEVAAKGKVKAGKKRFVLQKFSAFTAAGRTARITLNPKAERANRKLGKALDRDKKVVATLKIVLTDDAGNTETKRPQVRLK